jgi:hypothetical protein
MRLRNCRVTVAVQHLFKKLQNCDCGSASFKLRNCDCRLKSCACPPLTNRKYVLLQACLNYPARALKHGCTQLRTEKVFFKVEFSNLKKVPEFWRISQMCVCPIILLSKEMLHAKVFFSSRHRVDLCVSVQPCVGGGE